MKKIIIAIIASLTVLSSCSKESLILGSWKLETIQLQGITVNAAEMGMDVLLTFKDGNIVEMTTGGATETTEYIIKDNKIIVDDEEMEFELSGKTLILKGTFEMGDSEGGMITLTFRKS